MSPKNQSPDDASLWAAWVHRHGRAVRGYLLGMLRRHDLADDLMQEVFCRAWQARDRYQEEGTARAYLLRIADRLVVDHHRRAGREFTIAEESWKEIEPVQPAASPDETLVQQEAFGQLTVTLDSLPPLQRRVLLLRYYGELSFAEIAALLECPLSTALSHCHRGLLTLRKLLVETDK
jgi:RNA polymerase sigma-70 factor, ECF subfamily